MSGRAAANVAIARSPGRYVRTGRASAPDAAQAANLLWQMTRRQLWARYRGSVLGFAWSQLNPLLLMIIYSVVFRFVLRMEVAGTSYPAFFLTGLLAWNAFRTAAMNAGTSILDGAPLIHKAPFPRVVLPLAAVLANGVNYLLALPLLVVFNAALGEVPGPTDLPWLLVGLLIALAAAGGLGLALASITPRFRDTTQIAEAVFTAWFFATPVLYPLELARANLPPLASVLYELNPAVGIVSCVHGAFLGRPVEGRAVGIAAAVAILLLAAGAALFRRERDRFVEHC